MKIVKRSPFRSLNVNGNLFLLETPAVMGILNITPDSFFAGSRCETTDAIAKRADQIIAEGGTIIDLGAYSSRPQAENISANEEMERLSFALEIVRKRHPNVVISIDTFRSQIAKQCVQEYGANIINDISAGEIDPEMISTMGTLGVPYIAMHMRGTPQTMQHHTQYGHIVADLLQYFSRKAAQCREAGINDLIIDPGFGFSKTIDNNYQLMNHLGDFQLLNLPILVGISRKSMIYKLNNTTPAESLNGTTVLNTLAVLGGADIVRVHDVKEAVQTIQLIDKTLKSE